MRYTRRAEDRTEDWCDEEHPELFHRPAADEDRGDRASAPD
jgi:hypothetical protein